ncbi:hypothetical protein OH738_10685 [Streptomyces hirsutus]|uniref:HTH marR-type domain-containing protein n=1 Tax=Streptomyces hirsutus TaxID=35620 RepID=A0ABZ1GT94_9ACTN|nr:hypothetical protein [Streptomyces hirsutus]WSD09345.1 hypothetical protein OIE73_28790 [Streptomyces hirsutus]WTD17205.1 hypothetical protein OH738_10685 [Streptomyces hirsutus]
MGSSSVDTAYVDARRLLDLLEDRDLSRPTRLVGSWGLLATGPHSAPRIAEKLGLAPRTVSLGLLDLAKKGIAHRRFELDEGEVPRPVWTFDGARNRPTATPQERN